MACSSITIGATQLVTLDELADNSNNGAWVNNASVTGTLYDATRTTSLATFSLTYVNGSNGQYTGTISAATTGTLSAGTEYRIKVVATVTGNTFVEWLDTVASY